MIFICLEFRDTKGIIGYLVYDSVKKFVLKYSYSELLTIYKSGKVQFYGVEVKKNKFVFPGYSFLPNLLKGYAPKLNYYIVVGRFIEKKQKKYLLVRADGTMLNLSENKAIELNNCGRIVNTVKGVNYIKLKKGSLPNLTSNTREQLSRNDSSTDTVKKLDLTEKERKKIYISGTPGVAKKFFGVTIPDNKRGVVKRSVVLHGYDNVNEVVCYELGKLFGVSVCEAKFVTYNGGTDWVISLFSEDILNENSYFRSAKSVFGTENFKRNFSVKNIDKYFGKKAVDNFNRMVIFDTLTRQEDRHINNFAFLKDDMYPLYDNGRCLFWDVENLNKIGIQDIISTFEVNEHGYGWMYIDGVLGMQECRRLITNNISYKDILNILSKYYSKNRAEVLSKYIYNVYSLLMGYSFERGEWYEG